LITNASVGKSSVLRVRE